ASRSARDSNSKSAAILMVASGVRSSCDTSETNCRWTLDSSSSSRSLPCRLDAISLNEVASAARSSTPSTRMRSSRCPADSRWAAWAACRTGSTTQRVTSDAIAASSTARDCPSLPTRVVGSYCGTGTYWLSNFSSDCSWLTPASSPDGPDGMVAEGLMLYVAEVELTCAPQGTLAA